MFAKTSFLLLRKPGKSDKFLIFAATSRTFFILNIIKVVVFLGHRVLRQVEHLFHFALRAHVLKVSGLVCVCQYSRPNL